MFVDDYDSLRDMLVDAFTKAGANVRILGGDADRLEASPTQVDKFIESFLSLLGELQADGYDYDSLR